MQIGIGIDLTNETAENELTLLLNDAFTNDRSAGSVDGTSAEPGPGTRTVVDSAGTKLSISGSELVFVGGSSLDPGIWYDALDREAGLCLLVGKINFDDNLRFHIGFASSSGGTPGDVRREAATLSTNDQVSLNLASWPAGAADYTIAIVLRPTGGYLLFKESGTTWKLTWVEDTGTADPVYPALADKNGTDCTVDEVKAAVLGAGFGGQYDLATSRLAGSRSSGDTYTHEADFVQRATVTTVPASGAVRIDFRIQDSDNLWSWTVNGSGDLSLSERIAGTNTVRGTAAAAIANGEAVTVVADDETINIHDGGGTASRKINYSSAANFKIETAGEIQTIPGSGAVSDVECYPRILSGADLAAVEALENG
ncbi:MAG: hypothetical protein WAM60_20410 [Candidatus Promineifilaceae bacterium]